jgi:hypothetical protein
MSENSLVKVNKSEQIRNMLSTGAKRAEICKALEVQYQFVVNVEKKMKENAGKEPKVIEVVKPEHVVIASNMNSKSGSIRYLLECGYQKATIAKQLGVLYQFVRNVEVKMSEVKVVNVDLLKNNLNNLDKDQLEEIKKYLKGIKK